MFDPHSEASKTNIVSTLVALGLLAVVGIVLIGGWMALGTVEPERPVLPARSTAER